MFSRFFNSERSNVKSKTMKSRRLRLEKLGNRGTPERYAVRGRRRRVGGDGSFRDARSGGGRFVVVSVEF